MSRQAPSFPAARSPTGTAAEPADPAVRVLRRFRVVFNAVRKHFQQVEAQAGLGGAQAWALSVIRERPGIGVSELARAMDIHQSTASNLVKQLVARELVTTAPHPLDKRAVELRLLGAGEQVLGRWTGPFSGVLPAALNALDEPTLQRLDEDLGKLIARLDVDEAAAKTPLADL